MTSQTPGTEDLRPNEALSSEENQTEADASAEAAADVSSPAESVPTETPEDSAPADEPEVPAAAPADEAQQPADEAQQPVDEAQQPADEAQQPADEAQQPADEAQQPADEAQQPADEAQQPGETARVARGSLVEGTITETAPTSITVDLGDDLIGVVPGRELDRMGRKELEDLAEGQTITVYVVNPRDHEGKVVLSINRAIEELDWQRALEFSSSGEVYQGEVAGYNKGGLIVRFGRLRGFVPQSQIADQRRRRAEGDTPEDRFSNMVNETIFVKVMEVERGRNRLILSERAATREVREQRKVELIDQLEVGQVVEGRVISLEDFGAFVDVGGAEGLVHLTEITWKHITHPRDTLRVGQTVKVEVISVDRDRKRIGLSIKRQAADPWDEVATTYQVGDLVKGTVTKLTKFGAFARLVDAEDIEGLIHISELSEERVANPREVVQEGEVMTLRVVKIDVKNRRLGLSLKAVNSAEYLDRDMQTFASDSNG